MINNQHSSIHVSRLRAFYNLQIVQIFFYFIYFISEILLFIFLVTLPMQLAFSWKIKQQKDIQKIQHFIDITATALFVMHIILYFYENIKQIVLRPHIKHKLMLFDHVLKDKWVRLISFELIFDILCLSLSIYILANEETIDVRTIELIYLLKIYKLKVFHDRCTSWLIGTPFFIIYNLFYGLFIFLIIASYVGCAFYEIDYSIYQDQESPYIDLLWIVDTGSMTGIVQQPFQVQLLYTMYWSIGTASTAAYGDISAAQPQDIVFNILCLLFQGFIFGFYISRIHNLPEELKKKQNDLLQIFEQFQRHNTIISQNTNIEQIINKDLEFKILCSLEYQQSKRKAKNQISELLPEKYLIELKVMMYRQVCHSEISVLFENYDLKQKICSEVKEFVTEEGQDVYQYNGIKYDDLFFIKDGEINFELDTNLEIQYLQTLYGKKSFGIFSFVTGLKLPYRAKCQHYCTIFQISRQAYKKCLSIEQKVNFDGLFHQCLSMNSILMTEQPITKFNHYLISKQINLSLMNPQRCAYLTQNTLKKSYQSSSMKRIYFERSGLKSRKLDRQPLTKTKNTSVQCDKIKERSNFNKFFKQIINTFDYLMRI